MRFEVAARRLASLPRPLPLPALPDVLEPIVLAARDGAPTRRPGLPIRREAAALVLLFPDRDGQARLVLIRRPEGPFRHAGEVALPGGAIEPEDGSAEAAAVREAHEEVGLDADAAGLTVLGQLGPVEVRVSGFRLVGVVAVAQTEPSLVADPWEVASILLPPADAFLPHAPIEVVELERDGWRLRYGAYPIEGARVWGATARLLAQLGGLLGGANPGGA